MHRGFSEKLRRLDLMFLILSAFLLLGLRKQSGVWVFFKAKGEFNSSPLYEKGKNYILILIYAGLSKLKLQDGGEMAYW